MRMNSEAGVQFFAIPRGATTIYVSGDLDRNPRNPRSLFGLSESLKAQKRDYDAQFVDKQFQSSWKATDIKLRIVDLT